MKTLLEKAKKETKGSLRYPYSQEELELTLAYLSGEISYSQYSKTIRQSLGFKANGGSGGVRAFNCLRWGMKNNLCKILVGNETKED